jgi:hypothetical protein
MLMNKKYEYIPYYLYVYSYTQIATLYIVRLLEKCGERKKIFHVPAVGCSTPAVWPLSSLASRLVVLVKNVKQNGTTTRGLFRVSVLIKKH